ncbi:MAG: DNA-binding protein [Muribaculaceae bacterium]|nr:DNA-binding protein [Muribaculaceae bacterium]
MKEIKPSCHPEGVYSGKRACYELGICYKTLTKYKNMGLIKAINPGNRYRLKYSGQAIIDCWLSFSKL